MGDWVIIIVFLAAIGGCVGSFLNVVIFRVPDDLSLIWPPSHCPQCRNQLKWWENVPVLSWFYLKGRCRYCQAPIHMQYPIVEAIGAALFVGLYLVYYTDELAVGLGHPYSTGFAQSWPIYAVHIVLLCALLATTWIDAKLYIIPLEIPWLSTGIALIALPVFALWRPDSIIDHIVMPTVTVWGVNAAFGGVAGLLLAMLLLHWKILPRSFDDEEMHELEEKTAQLLQTDGEPVEQPQSSEETDEPAPGGDAEDQEQSQPEDESAETEDEPTEAPTVNPAEVFLTYSHPRREVLKEVLFVAFPIIGVIAAWMLEPWPAQPGFSPFIRVLAGVVYGYLVGGGMVWLTRIFGTLGFGKEAMGQGDVHLMAAIGAALGWKAVCLIFVIAPFLGLTYVVLAVGASRAMRGQVRIIPYGPYIALATLVVMLFPGPVWAMLRDLIW